MIYSKKLRTENGDIKNKKLNVNIDLFRENKYIINP